MADKFWINSESGFFICTARGVLKDTGIFVGDKVGFDLQELNIEKVFERENFLIRPQMANLNQLLIVLSHEPQPDYLMLDKLLVFCQINKIKPIICLNKIDKNSKHQIYLQKVYAPFFEFLPVSAYKNINIDILKTKLNGKISAFAGQSGVGKSALINAVFGNEKAIEGLLSKRITRGKNTTRHVELYEISQKSYIADTPGFSALDEKLLPITETNLPYYYPDFLQHLNVCKYKSCLHYKEMDCGVKKALASGCLDEARYNRYLIILKSLQEKPKY